MLSKIKSPGCDIVQQPVLLFLVCMKNTFLDDATAMTIPRQLKAIFYSCIEKELQWQTTVQNRV
jgi:hypothetical protein